MDGQSLHEPAWAKINLGLKVMGRRPDGYHEIRSVVQTVSLADRLSLTPAEADGFRCDAADLPAGQTNLVVRAREAFRTRWTGARRPVQLHLAKEIPVGAGLGGGSADAAAALRLLNRFHNGPLTVEELRVLAASIGSDVPFLLTGGTARMAGRGEVLEPLGWTARVWYVLVYPGVAVSTAWAYGQVSPGLTTPTPYLNFINSLSGGSVHHEALFAVLENDFQPVVERAYPIVAHVRSLIGRTGARVSSMSGSGSTVYGVYDDRNAAIQAQHELEAQGYRSFLCHPAPGA